jgi:hypothetical protein
MNYWLAGALLFCVGLFFWYRTLVRPELVHMSSVRKFILLFATVIVLVYQVSMVQVLETARQLYILPPAMILLSSSAASAALIVELVRIVFFPGRTWRDKFHFSLVVLCWVVMCFIQFTLITVIRGGLLKS